MTDAIIQQTVYRAIKYRAYPTPDEIKIIEKHFDAVRQIFNTVLEANNRYQEENHINMSSGQIASLASMEAKNFPGINRDAAYLVGPRITYGLARSKKEGEGSLKFKTPGDTKASFSVRYKHPYYEVLSKGARKRAFFRISGIGDIIVAFHREIPENANCRLCTISRNSAGQYYLSIDYSFEQTVHLPPKIKKPLGLDFSVPKLFVASDKELLSNVDMLEIRRRFSAKISMAHKKLSRCQPGSKNYEKAKKHLAKLYQRMDNIRLDYIHKETTLLAKKYDFIGIESLDLRDMGQRFGLYKAIQDDSWYRFTSILGYKLRRKQRVCHGVSRYYPSSKTCHRCGFINHKLTIADRIFVCPVCGNRVDRDQNAAKNIRDQALRDNGYHINYIRPSNAQKKERGPSEEAKIQSIEKTQNTGEPPVKKIQKPQPNNHVTIQPQNAIKQKGESVKKEGANRCTKPTATKEMPKQNEKTRTTMPSTKPNENESKESAGESN